MKDIKDKYFYFRRPYFTDKISVHAVETEGDDNEEPPEAAQYCGEDRDRDSQGFQ
jgi:hypothetical protein